MTQTLSSHFFQNIYVENIMDKKSHFSFLLGLWPLQIRWWWTHISSMSSFFLTFVVLLIFGLYVPLQKRWRQARAHYQFPFFFNFFFGKEKKDDAELHAHCCPLVFALCIPLQRKWWWLHNLLSSSIVQQPCFFEKNEDNNKPHVHNVVFFFFRKLIFWK